MFKAMATVQQLAELPDEMLEEVEVGYQRGLLGNPIIVLHWTLSNQLNLVIFSIEWGRVAPSIYLVSDMAFYGMKNPLEESEYLSTRTGSLTTQYPKLTPAELYTLWKHYHWLS